MRGTVIAATLAALLAGCSAYDSVTQKIAQSITPYRITVVQGNFVSAEAAAQMQVGMSRDQVKQLLGTPLLIDMFHADRWDYVFYFKRGSTAVVQQRDFVVNFASDRVVSWSGGENLPSNLELLAEIDGDKGVKVAKTAPGAAAAAPASAASAASGVAVTAPAGEPSTQPNASNAFAGDANQQAAQAANRATAQVEMPAGRQRSSAFSSAPTSAGGAPGAGGASGSNSQIQLQRKPQTIQIPDSSAVGPASTSPAPAGSNSGQPQFTMPQ
ncbi:outer membrane protein assembly factor BamE [Caballeronia sp. LZ034LL]|uniref:outer membrane protein assembly factor BamE n=1 Tax=Caballeronia sp. LZ034LL TaxID=3038567 RepID=UPI00286324FA|nr:outer membrane protein assembly factor BamE [Caballeronia sp. LZ034LL]MDR5834798.1 outer membrane protein assembly factor BamE [Caballeronia sp. LZ034LL]